MSFIVLVLVSSMSFAAGRIFFAAGCSGFAACGCLAAGYCFTAFATGSAFFTTRSAFLAARCSFLLFAAGRVRFAAFRLRFAAACIFCIGGQTE